MYVCIYKFNTYTFIVCARIYSGTLPICYACRDVYFMYASKKGYLTNILIFQEKKKFILFLSITLL